MTTPTITHLIHLPRGEMAYFTSEKAAALARERLQAADLMANSLLVLSALGNLTGKQRREIEHILKEAGYGPVLDPSSTAFAPTEPVEPVPREGGSGG